MLGPPSPYPILARFTPDHRPLFLTAHQRASFISLLQRQVSELTADLASLRQELVWAEQNLETQRMHNSLLASAAEFSVNALKAEIAELTLKMSQLASNIPFNAVDPDVCLENGKDPNRPLKRKGVEFFRISSSNDLSTLAGNSSGAEATPRELPIRTRPAPKKDWSSRIGFPHKDHRRLEYLHSNNPPAVAPIKYVQAAPQPTTPITRSYSTAVHPSSVGLPSSAGHHPAAMSYQVPMAPWQRPVAAAPVVMSPRLGVPQPSAGQQPPGPASAADIARLERQLAEARADAAEYQRRSRQAAEVKEKEIQMLRETIKQMAASLKEKDDGDSNEILRGKFEALTKINTTLRNENKTLNLRLKHDFVPIAEYEKLKARLTSTGDKENSLSKSFSGWPTASLLRLIETPPVSARKSSGRFSVDIKPLDLENLRSGVGVGALPRVTARQTARLAAEEEEKQQLERRVKEATAGVTELTMDQAVEFAAKLLGEATLPKVHVFRLFRCVSESEVLVGETEVREFAKLVLKFI